METLYPSQMYLKYMHPLEEKTLRVKDMEASNDNLSPCPGNARGSRSSPESC